MEPAIWQSGPLPPDTWYWGAVVVKGREGSGFYFADFNGDHAKLVPDGRVVSADDVALWVNCIRLPSGIAGRNDS
jgi:hypothetical protein